MHVNRPLTNISIAYTQKAVQFAAASVFPVVPVQNQSDVYYTYTKGDWLRLETRERAPGTESAGSGYNVDNTANYNCRVYAVHKDVDDQIAGNTDAPLDAYRDATEWVTLQMLLYRETVWATNYFATSKWTGSSTGTDLTTSDYTAWDNPASDPITAITTEATAIQEGTGLKPNVLVLGPEVYNKLKQHPDIVDRVKYTQRGIVTRELLAALFEVDKVVVPYATRNTAVEGATTSMDFVFGKNALLVYAAPSPSLMNASGGYIFSWQGYLGASRDGMRIKRFYMDELESERIEGQLAFDAKLVAADVGAFFSSMVS